MINSGRMVNPTLGYCNKLAACICNLLLCACTFLPVHCSYLSSKGKSSLLKRKAQLRSSSTASVLMKCGCLVNTPLEIAIQD